MRKALIPAFLLVLGSMVLGATVLREPIAHATSPFQPVIVGNDTAHPVPTREQNLDAGGNVKVHEQGTADVNVTNSALQISGTPAVKIDPSGNTVNLGSTDSGKLDTANTHLSNIETSVGHLQFNGSGALKVDTGATGSSDLTPTDRGFAYVSGLFTVSSDHSVTNAVGPYVHAVTIARIDGSCALTLGPALMLIPPAVGLYEFAHPVAATDFTITGLGGDCHVSYSVVGSNSP